MVCKYRCFHNIIDFWRINSRRTCELSLLLGSCGPWTLVMFFHGSDGTIQWTTCLTPRLRQMRWTVSVCQTMPFYLCFKMNIVLRRKLITCKGMRVSRMYKPVTETLLSFHQTSVWLSSKMLWFLQRRNHKVVKWKVQLKGSYKTSVNDSRTQVKSKQFNSRQPVMTKLKGQRPRLAPEGWSDSAFEPFQYTQHLLLALALAILALIIEYESESKVFINPWRESVML